MSNGTVDITIMDPNAAERFHRGSRFSPVAFVMTATKDGKSFLFCPTNQNPDHDGAGLATEFDILTVGGPPGFQEAAIGEGYLKVGVGVLRKHEKHYRFEVPQEIIERAETTLSLSNGQAVFHQRSDGLNGYAYALSATVSLEEASIIIRYTLTNTGSRPFVTDNYAHNYFRFDNWQPGPAYEIAFPYDVTEPDVFPLRLLASRVFTYRDKVERPINVNVPYPSAYRGPNRVTVFNREAGMTVEVLTSVPGTRTFLHTTDAYLSPEQFIRLSLRPGQRTEWTRSYHLRFQ